MENEFMGLDNTNIQKSLEEKLVDAYIGDEAENIKEQKVNWIAAIIGQSIGPLWFFYRKSYLVGFLAVIVTFLVGSIASSLNIDKAYYIMFVIYLFTANKVYLWDVKRKVNKILKNTNMSENEMINLARRKGGVSYVAVGIYIFVFILFIALILIKIFLLTSLLFDLAR